MRKAACIASTAVLLAALAFLGLKVKEFNGTEHEQFQTALWQLKHLGTAFNEDVLEARFALLDNYDDFQQYKEQAEDAVKALNRPPAFVTSTGRKAIAEARVEYTELLR